MFRISSYLLIMVLIPAGAVCAESRIIDPMRPPSAKSVNANSGLAKKPGWSVTEILISPKRRLAVVNGRVVRVGSIVNGAKVSAIYGNAVKLDIEGKAVFIAPVGRDIKRQSR